MCSSYKQFIKLRKEVMKSVLYHKRKNVHVPKVSSKFRKLPDAKYRQSISIFKFEKKMSEEKIQICIACKGRFLCTRILKPQARNKSGVCDTCQKMEGFVFEKTNHEKNYAEQLHQFYLDNEMLPVWYDENDHERKFPHYEIPDELKNMTFTEQMLIQMYSAYVPVFCINNKGNIGYKGHCVCFPQNINQVCESLPRKKSDIVRVIKKYIQCNDEVVSHFKVRKTKVMTALTWLKTHNKYYHELKIDESNLSWMRHEEDSIVDNDTIMKLNTGFKSRNESDNIPFISSIQKEQNTNHNIIDHMGLSNMSVAPTMNENDKKIKNTVNEKLASVGSNNVLMFPDIATDPVTEYDEDIFPKIFPVLYPGGIGGFNNKIAQVNKNQYGKRLLSYEDGRFSTNKTWSFYMMDVIQRDQNNKDGNFVIKRNHFGKDYQTLEDLIERINEGDMSWINLVRNYSHRIRGSDNYWRSKKYELEAWINHHVSKGHGPPTLFITLSCAENWWPDLKRLLLERLKGTLYEDLIPEINNNDTERSRKATCKAAELFSITVQQFFQIRVQEWINTVGKEAMDIDYYWGRFEFAKGRGQIHIHMLCITKNRRAFKEYFIAKQKGNHKKAVDVLSEYAKNQFGLTAEHPSYEENCSININKICPPEGIASLSEEMELSLTKKYIEVNDPLRDLCSLCNACQLHECNSFCLRDINKKNEGKRYCRCGCGLEITKGSANTPGFPHMEENDIVMEKERHIQVLRMKRKGSRRFVQSSTVALQSWRANCDVQILIYNSDPECPNLEEIRRVSDYVVSYTTKVNQTIAEEKRVCLEIAKGAATEYSSENDNLVSVVKKILNSFNGKRIIPRPEVMVELDQLPLIISSERIIHINISSGCRIFYEKKKDKKKGSSFVSKYAQRKQKHLHMNLMDYFYEIHKNHKNIIPFPVGRRTTPTYKKKFDGTFAVHPEYIKSALILYKPWKNDECSKFLQDERIAYEIYYKYLKSPRCPDILKAAHKLALKYQDNKIDKIAENIEKETFLKFNEGYTPCSEDEEEMYFTYLRSLAVQGSYTYCEHTIHIDHTIRWWEKNCDVSHYY